MPRTPKSQMLNREQRILYGQSRRKVLRRVDQREWQPRNKRFDPIALIVHASRGRLPQLLPIKWGRMAESPFGFFRGAVPLMALDLSHLPVTGLPVQICGDAHVRNFGAYAAPDGRLIFDINDFDETIEGPWEWDVKRMAASLVLAGRESGNRDSDCKEAVMRFVRSYRETMQMLSRLTALDLARFVVHRMHRLLPLANALHKAERATPQQALEHLTVRAKGSRRSFRTIKKLTMPVSQKTARQVWQALEAFRETLTCEHKHFLTHYHPLDVAFKVVGTGSVGTRDYALLFVGSGRQDALFLQVKEEPPSSYAPYLPRARSYENQGRRVVEGQRLMQSQSDIFLGWTSLHGRDYLVRQLRDHKASVDPEDLKGRGLGDYALLCGELLAKGHARTGDACAIAGYCGNGEKLDIAIAKFAFAYAEQSARDHEKLQAAIRRGHLSAERI